MHTVQQLALIVGAPERRVRYILRQQDVKPVATVGNRLRLFVVDLPELEERCRMRKKPGPRPRRRE